MKKVKFNAAGPITTMADEPYKNYVKQLEEAELTDLAKADALKKTFGSRFKIQDVAIGQIVEVPDWWYENNKARTVKMSVSIDNFVNENGDRMPFKMSEAIKHKHVTSRNMMQVVPYFELVK